MLTDSQWALIEPHCLDKPSDPGHSGRSNRLFMEAMFRSACTGGIHGAVCRRRSVTGVRRSALNFVGIGGDVSADTTQYVCFQKVGGSTSTSEKGATAACLLRSHETDRRQGGADM